MGRGDPYGPKKHVRKRARRCEDDDDDDDGDEGGDATTDIQPKRPCPGPEAGTLLWACPFFKKDPIHFMDCMSFKLKRIQDVKQHIARKHSQPSIYCPVCQQEFSKIPQRDHHIRQRECSEPPRCGRDAPTASISAEKQKELRSRMSGTDIAVWYRIWNVLFDDTSPPATPYQTTMIEEVTDVLQSFWERYGPDIISEITDRHPRGPALDVIRPHLPGLMSMAFSRLADRLRCAINKTESPEPTSPTSDNSGVSKTSSAMTDATTTAPCTPLLLLPPPEAPFGTEYPTSMSEIGSRQLAIGDPSREYLRLDPTIPQGLVSWPAQSFPYDRQYPDRHSLSIVWPDFTARLGGDIQILPSQWPPTLDSFHSEDSNFLREM